MAPTTATSTSSKLSEKELLVLGLAWQCMESEPKIDMKKLAILAGYTEGSAKTTFGLIKKKLREMAAEAGDDGTVTQTPTTPKATPKKRRSKAEAVDGEGSPVKKARGGKKAAAKAASETVEETRSDKQATVKTEAETMEEEVSQPEEV